MDEPKKGATRAPNDNYLDAAAKSGKATYGLDRFYNGKASRAERGLEISMMAVVDVEQAIGYSLSVQQTPTSEPDRAQGAERTRVDDYLDHLQATRASLPAAVRHLVGDGFYSKVGRRRRRVESGRDWEAAMRCQLEVSLRGAAKVARCSSEIRWQGRFN